MNSTDQSGGLRMARFDCFEMDFVAQELRKNGRKIPIQEQPFKVLQSLASHPKQPLLREELYAHLPSHNNYDLKHGLDNAVQRIRKALGDSVEKPRFVETLRGRGYRFLKDVEFIPHLQPENNSAALPRADLFTSSLQEIRGEFLATSIPQKLGELFHRVTDLIDQHRDHPNKPEACVLLESIQSARSQNNVLQHKISFDSAALVFDDPLNTSIHAAHTAIWYTLGLVRRTMPSWGSPVVLLVTHKDVQGQISQPKGLVLSARKATKIERASYEQTNKKTR
jgi:DNA-binding winged helix-turn-helix (wHTH) protein/uncharacterized DUF497 family protein